MKCPIDDTELAMTDRQGIEIDYCPKCRGVWLDRGELDKIIDRSAELEAAAKPVQETRYREESKYREEPKYRDDYRDERGYRPHKKRKSLLGEIFDFD